MSTRIGAQTRAIAIDALTHILTRHIHSDVAMNKLFAHHKNLRPLDRAFIHEMVLGTLRWLGKVDWIMSHMVTKPFSSLDPRVANALRVGAYQIYYMDKVPERAAVSETVEAIKLVGAPNAASLVNAVLRRVAKKAEYFPKPSKTELPIDYYSMHYAHPKWMVERWNQQFVPERLEFLLAGNNQQPQNTLKYLGNRRPLPADDNLDSYLLREHSIESTWRPLKGALRVASLPRFEECGAFKEGHFIVQDEAAQLACSLVTIEKGEKVLDACAAPGGKSIFLWNAGVEPEHLTICDFSQKRMKLLEENFKRVGLTGATILHGDVVEKVQGQVFDKILLDAPCSAMGVIRRHPEIKWLRVPNDILQCAKEQKRLLDGLAENVAPGGSLVYVVCSNEREETSDQVQIFLENHPEFDIDSAAHHLHDYYKKYVTKNQELFIAPGNPDELDGFFAVILKRKN